MSEKLLGQLVELAGGTGWEIMQDHNIPWKSHVRIKAVTPAQAVLVCHILQAVIAAPFSVTVEAVP